MFYISKVLYNIYPTILNFVKHVPVASKYHICTSNPLNLNKIVSKKLPALGTQRNFVTPESVWHLTASQ
jgi:hypothetical protein